VCCGGLDLDGGDVICEVRALGFGIIIYIFELFYVVVSMIVI